MHRHVATGVRQTPLWLLPHQLNDFNIALVSGACINWNVNEQITCMCMLFLVNKLQISYDTVVSG